MFVRSSKIFLFIDFLQIKYALVRILFGVRLSVYDDIANDYLHFLPVCLHEVRLFLLNL